MCFWSETEANILDRARHLKVRREHLPLDI